MAGELKYVWLTSHKGFWHFFLEVKEYEIIVEAQACNIQHEFSCAEKMCAFTKNELSYCDVQICAGLHFWSFCYSYRTCTLHKKIWGLLYGNFNPFDILYCYSGKVKLFWEHLHLTQGEARSECHTQML